jgi:hypothetical protein
MILRDVDGGGNGAFSRACVLEQGQRRCPARIIWRISSEDNAAVFTGMLRQTEE